MNNFNNEKPVSLDAFEAVRAGWSKHVKASVGAPWYRTGRAIALSRLVLASVFLLAIYVDPSQPTAAPKSAYFILAIYVLIALVAVVTAWRSWWWDHRIARPLHVVDLLVFAVVVFATDGYTSPFFTFSLFLLLSVAMRWGGRETAITAITVNLLFLFAGLLSGLWEAIEIDRQRLVIRATYLAVLSGLCVWFTFDRDRLSRRFPLANRLQGPGERDDMLHLICEHVATRTGATKIICAQQDMAGQWYEISSLPDVCAPTRLTDGQDIDALVSLLSSEPFLLDPSTGRMLVGTGQAARACYATANLIRFCAGRHLGHLMCVPVCEEDLNCVILIDGLETLTADDLTTGSEIAEEIALFHRQIKLNMLTKQAATNSARLSVGRDLHDSVVQIVAAISFRLEGFKRSGMTAAELGPEIDVLQDELAVEQHLLRDMITELRQPRDDHDASDTYWQLSNLTGRLGRQWDIACLFQGEGAGRVSRVVEREMEQMIREGVANAVRHGNADRVTVDLKMAGHEIILEISDNGSGWSDANMAPPYSLNERAKALGATLEIVGDAEGTIIRISFPAGALA
ncbi:sensor histidine kinase [Sphingorhabdus sp.]|uniref:sensor histidine kinase n=1 Tax=Sphingorhabdus sp. TaxID=1902408 RepID=UPI00391AE22E